MAQEFRSTLTAQQIEDALVSVKETGLDKETFKKAIGKASAIIQAAVGIPSALSTLDIYGASPYALSNVYHAEAFNNLSVGVNSSSGDSACLVTVTTSDGSHRDNTTDFVLPYTVVIGDSIAEGHGALHGQLHASGVTIGYASQPGQISYSIGTLFNRPCINQGIGSQRIDQILARWDRDVLASQDDASGIISLPFGGQKPDSVYLHIGANDIASTPLQDMKDGYLFMAESCRVNGIKLLMANVGANSWNATAAQKVTDIAVWMNETFDGTTIYKDTVEIVDYLNWSSGGTNNPTTLKSGGYMSGIHPTITGYSDYGNFIFNNLKTQLKIKSITLNMTREQGAGTPSKLMFATELDVNGVLQDVEYYGDTNDRSNEFFVTVTNINTALFPIKVTKSVPRLDGGTTTSAYAGYSHGHSTLDNAWTPVVITETTATVGDLGNNVGTTAARPVLTEASSRTYFDADLGLPIWFNGTDWIKFDGTVV